jgi:uncharacterized phage protein gp47/JayE
MRPDLREIYENLSHGALLFSELDIFSKVTTGMTHMLHSYIDERVNNLIPDTAKGDELNRWAKALNIELNNSEDDEAKRFQIIDHLRRPPHGGCKWDFERWATTVEGVSKAFIFPTHPTLGSVGIACLDKDLKIINENTELAKNIIHEIELKKPITCRVLYVQLNVKPVKLNVRSSTDQKTSLKAISDFFKKHSPGSDEPEIHLSTIHRILLESGLRDYDLIEPSNKITLEKTEVPRLLEEEKIE